MKLKWAKPARLDRQAIREYIASDSPRAALDMDELIEKQAALLGDHPEMGRPGRVQGTREFVVHPHYVLIYDHSADTVRILRVLHAARMWPP